MKKYIMLLVYNVHKLFLGPIVCINHNRRMRMRDDPIARVLDDLLRFEDILACMVAHRGMISVMPSNDSNSFKPEIHQIWDGVKRTMDTQLEVISQIAGYDKMNSFIQDYEVLLYILQDTDTALVAIVPALANRGLIDVELERARQKIQKIREEK